MFLSFSVTSYFCSVCLLPDDLNLFPSPSFLPFLLFLSEQFFKVPENSWWLSGWVGDKGQAEQAAREERGAGPRTLGGDQGPLSWPFLLRGGGGCVPEAGNLQNPLWLPFVGVSQESVPCMALEANVHS